MIPTSQELEPPAIPVRFILLAENTSGLEVDQAVALLEEEEILVLTKGPEIGIFGPGFSGATALGVRLFVPSEALGRAQQLLQHSA